jgi:pyrroloquinoline quinone biosynthesis protein E
MMIDDHSRPMLARGVRMHTDPLTGSPVLLYPEGVLPMESTLHDILRLCSGRRNVGDIISTLVEEYESDHITCRREVFECLDELFASMLIVCPSHQSEMESAESPMPRGPSRSGAIAAAKKLDKSGVLAFRPYLLLAELTHRCPLHCPYCSNPAGPADGTELSTAEWCRIIEAAGKLGVLHIGFSGGEPLQRTDLVTLVAASREAGLYSNLITSAAGLTPRRAEELKAAGLDSVQISFQSDQETLANSIAGTTAHKRKLEAASLVRALGFPLTANVVLHRANISRVGEIISFAENLGAERLELANTQYYGWAFQNRSALLPTREQIERAAQITAAARQALRGIMEILFVIPDYYTERPKPCMHGWGSRFLTVNPSGDVLPCPTAGVIKDMRFENIRTHSLRWIWQYSEAFNRFRGTGWMPLPCLECEFREADFGGCRCQAALIAGDANVTDPACSLSPHRKRLSEFVASLQGADSAEWTSPRNSAGISFRQNPTRKDAGLPAAYLDQG